MEIHETFSQQSYSITLYSYETPSGTSQRCSVLIDGSLYYFGWPTSLHEGTHIISFLPDEEYNFSHWELVGGVHFLEPKDAYDNPSLIEVNGSGQIRAYYEKGTRLKVWRTPEMHDLISAISPIKLMVEVLSNNEPVLDAKVRFYVDSRFIGSSDTDKDGFASLKFAPSEEKLYSWYVRVDKIGYTSVTSDEWDLRYQSVRLEPDDNETLTELPIYLNAMMELDGEPLDYAIMSYYLDDVYLGDLRPQPNGYTSLTLTNVTAGPHLWNVLVKVPSYKPIQSETFKFTYLPQITSLLESPSYGEVISDFTSTVRLVGTVLSEGKPLQGANVTFYVDGDYLGSNVSNGMGLATFNFSPPLENETYSWFVVSSMAYHLNDTSEYRSFNYPTQPPYFEVDKIYTSVSRADIDSNQTIGFHLRWENGTDVRNAGVLLDDGRFGVTNELGWCYFNVSNSFIGGEEWKITSVSYEEIGEFKHNSKFPSIVWDRVIIDLSMEDERVDVGSSILPVAHAVYDSDDTPFNGSFQYNTELSSETVGAKKITVVGIEDNNYNLSSFISNEIEAVWDRVLIKLEIDEQRVRLGSKADVGYVGVYEYDNKKFDGKVSFDNDLRHSQIGKQKYRVESISDPLYNLTVFQSNKISCIFDDIEVVQKVNVLMPTQVQVKTQVYFKSDLIPVEDAEVRVNGIGNHIGDGVYSATLFTFLPFIKLQTEIGLGSWGTQFIGDNVLVVGNVVISSVFLLLLCALMVKMGLSAYKGVKSKHLVRDEFWKKLKKELKEEQLIRNWTVHSGFRGKGDFYAVYRSGDLIKIKSTNGDTLNEVRKKDFEAMYDKWKDYVKKRISRKELDNKIDFTKYTISILHQYENLMR